jgi:cell division protein FtsN
MARRNRNSRDKESAPGWVWMLFGLGLGLIVAIGVYLRAPQGARATDAVAAVPPPAEERPAARKTPQAAGASGARAERAENRFQFYEILPQLEVVVPDDVAPPAAAARRAPERPGSYLLQAGSFPGAADADRMQASLALLGFESHVQRVTLEGAIFHRVRIGPIDDLATAERTQGRLRDAGIDPLLIQVPK